MRHKHKAASDGQAYPTVELNSELSEGKTCCRLKVEIGFFLDIIAETEIAILGLYVLSQVIYLIWGLAHSALPQCSIDDWASADPDALGDDNAWSSTLEVMPKGQATIVLVSLLGFCPRVNFGPVCVEESLGLLLRCSFSDNVLDSCFKMRLLLGLNEIRGQESRHTGS